MICKQRAALIAASPLLLACVATAQVAYTLESNGQTAAATCMPSPIYPNSGPQSDRPAGIGGRSPLLTPVAPGTTFTLQTTNGCSGGITIDESVNNPFGAPIVYSTDGLNVFSIASSAYLPGLAAGVGSAGIVPVAPPAGTTFGGIAVTEGSTQLYLVAGTNLVVYDFTLLTTNVIPLTFIQNFFPKGTNPCLSGLDIDKCSNTLVATGPQGNVFNFTFTGSAVGGGFLGNFGNGGLITGLGIDDSAASGLGGGCVVQASCPSYLAQSIMLLSAGSPAVVGDGSMIAAGFGVSYAANETSALPIGLTIVADPQFLPGGAGTPSSELIDLTAPMTANNLATVGVFGTLPQPGCTVSYLTNTCPPATPVTGPGFTSWFWNGTIVTLPGTVSAVPMAPLPIGSDFMVQGAHTVFGPLLLTDGMSIRYSR